MASESRHVHADQKETDFAANQRMVEDQCEKKEIRTTEEAVSTGSQGDTCIRQNNVDSKAADIESETKKVTVEEGNCSE